MRQLAQVWAYSTGDLKTKADAINRASFEDTPILADGRLYVCSPFNEVSAIDPGTGNTKTWRPGGGVRTAEMSSGACRI
ncbi:MAG: hypothetical protein JOZ55_04480 [Alphaproteobacteria bacterium]|nr:hypothetical protein [Alphaproteobacteria bacterium]